jgi:predicted metalloprotease with PDZ domain
VRVAPAVALGVVLTACGVRDAAAPVAAPPSYEYAIVPPPRGSWTLAVEARLERAPSDRLVVPEAAGATTAVEVSEGGSWRPVARAGDAWSVPGCRGRCTLRYRVDLVKLGAACRGMDCTRRIGDAIIGSASTWMLRPEPSGEAAIHVDVSGAYRERMATGLRRDPRGGFTLRARELGEASYTAFGDMRRARAEVPGAALDVALLGPPLAMGDDAVVGWVRGAAGCVASLFGRFPADATVFVLPVRGPDELVFGRVLSLAGGSVELLFGSETRASSAHQDWVAVHELFHLGTPSFVGEGHWLEEGLATYYEPVLRRRASWLRDGDLWAHFAREMPRGLRREGAPPALEDRDDIDSTYWGGALFALLADVRIREATRGARSLDDVMRAALERLGDGTHEATVAAFLRLGDEVTGTRVLEDLDARIARAGEAVDLAALWRSLGVVAHTDGSVELVEGAPLAGVRRGIGAGAGH